MESAGAAASGRGQVAAGAEIRSTTIGAEPRVFDFLLRFSHLDRVGEQAPPKWHPSDDTAVACAPCGVSFRVLSDWGSWYPAAKRGMPSYLRHTSPAHHAQDG